MLDGLPVQDVENPRPRMAMGGEDHAGPTADQLHRPAIGPAKILYLHACDRGGGSPREGRGIRKQVVWRDRLCGFCHLSPPLSAACGSWSVAVPCDVGMLSEKDASCSWKFCLSSAPRVPNTRHEPRTSARPCLRSAGPSILRKRRGQIGPEGGQARQPWAHGDYLRDRIGIDGLVQEFPLLRIDRKRQLFFGEGKLGINGPSISARIDPYPARQTGKVHAIEPVKSHPVGGGSAPKDLITEAGGNTRASEHGG